jgi:cytochrome c oxidase subunit IV
MDATTHTHAQSSDNSKVIWRTFWILLGITLVELTLAFLHLYAGFLSKYVLNGIFLILTLAKAFYIVAEFMHLGHEIKNLIMTIVFPLLIFVWFIIAFLWDGSSYKNLRDTHNPQLKKYAPVQQQHGGGHSEGEHH